MNKKSSQQYTRTCFIDLKNSYVRVHNFDTEILEDIMIIFNITWKTTIELKNLFHRCWWIALAIKVHYFVTSFLEDNPTSAHIIITF